ncbi:DUF4332 domain-containing protein [Hyphomicrobium sp.]|uniref:DUF4332 domain-containing protein n=1 Tax=Hyphomicrobium sp. TaxID=82 RepID=UPI002C7AE3DD|nr:DUF4332 domain-containing protein [Hyphomicrobium sp.]HRN87604.1 DUF4332 domain-containing protein [Hyphomicrobium sp.]HRQ27971.1 DUF4332 domain-containing protein [Hyphomicrobium sp.]
MSLLFRIVYAAHATGTHHKLALDALRALDNADAEGWRRLFLKHAEIYMQGSKAPDNEFKDFKNHVLHVRDNYWGGALDKAEKWYGIVVDALARGDWEEAVWSAGVLSHYVTDPIQPFHTGQSEAENSVHRAAEWSISRSYNDLRAQGLATHGEIKVEARDGPGWLRELVCNGAEKANVHYEKLIVHYDLHLGVSDPPAGLDELSRTILSELVVYASAAFATVLDRALAESGATPPEVSLGLDTIMAAIKIPAKTLAKRLVDSEDRRVVEAMYDELMTTGRVDATLPEDDRVISRLYAKEVEAPRTAQQAAARAEALAATKPAPIAKASPQPLSAQMPANLRPYLALTDNIERAPSIGPRTAERMAPLGIKTVADFLAADTATVAAGMSSRWITANTITLWQDQCRLMLDVPGLRGTHAELLAQSGYRSGESLASADADKLCADVLAFAATSAGRRLLRDGAPPDVSRIKSWLNAATEARRAA